MSNKQNFTDKAKEKVEDAKQMVEGAKQATKLAANAASGNWLGAAKNALNLLKNKKLMKRMIIQAVLPVFISILIVVIIASAVFTVFTTIKEKMIELASNTKTAVTGFWKWFTDDYWIKLDEKVEVTTIDDSGRRNNQKYYNC